MAEPSLEQEALLGLEETLCELARERLAAGFGQWLSSPVPERLGQHRPEAQLEEAYGAGWRAAVTWLVTLGVVAGQLGTAGQEAGS